MIRSRVTLVLFVVIASITNTQVIGWNFWNDDKDSTTARVESMDTEILSPETLKAMMGSDYMDRVRSLISSGDSSAEADNSLTTMPPSTNSLSPPSTIAPAEVPSPALSHRNTSPLSLEMPAAHLIATPLTVTSSYESTYRNWVGPWSQSADSACYREAHIMKTCPNNYDRNDLTNTCWAECPIDYPVECGMQCIQQNNGCGREDLAKISAVAMSALSMATFGVFGELVKVGKTVKWAVLCGNMLLVAVRAIIRFTRNQMVLDPQTSQQKLLLLLYQTNWVVADLPSTIYVCMGKNTPPGIRVARGLMPTVQFILLLVIGYEDGIVSSWGEFKAFMTKANFTKAANEITEGEISSLETAMKQNSTCSDELRSLTNLVWMTISEYREKHPGISEAEIRLKMSQSNLVLYDIPTVTNNCMTQMTSESTEVTAYKTRQMLRKTYGIIINDLIKEGKSDNGTTFAAKENAYLWTDITLTLASVTSLEPTDLSTLFSEFLQTICGPTRFMGEIDDGNDAATLGMNALMNAFKNSTSSWTRKGDGVVIIHFTSKDTEDVTVNIMSGGDKIDEVDLKARGTAQWKSTVQALGGKTLYMDRWRPGFLGLPTRGGGSLMLWVPIARDGGHLEIEVQLNVT